MTREDLIYSTMNSIGFQQTHPKLYELCYCLLYGKKVTKELMDHFNSLQFNEQHGFGYINESLYMRIKSFIN